MKQINPDDLKKLKNLSFDEAKEIYSLFPVRLLCNLYAKYLKDSEIITILNFWDSKNDSKRIVCLCKQLIKRNKKHLIPINILEKFL